MPQKVQVYIYDLSMGLASQFSALFLGKQINGIWHTGIVVYGKEWFYGGEGIMHTHPGGTVMGPPHQVEDLGETDVPEEIFRDYLKDISAQFSNQTYNLFTNNCNTFSNEIAQFLTSRSIPEHISNLPQEVLETPFGAQIKPMLDQMQNIRGNFEQPLPAAPPQARQSTSTSTARPAPTATGGSQSFPESDILKITSKGFSRSEALKELDKCNGDADKALVCLLARSLKI
ncbi:PREDICTED: desumoylating isopeptidase 1-like [Amphimedon queenslandica]|uniref:UBA domain-containing protein n=1 Tax=Amphimedon queenslandica TaxID=400682 RepID=A0A1X7VLS6_AMPQE|nr:PREDICTED: desumoylating isopeptidase 1-like [Amphimedon queenslandica]|eukprot:XP_003383659.1 PREDICTED: desumoylating isopeptidase 1-like [Amphimedon queenslandica]